MALCRLTSHVDRFEDDGAQAAVATAEVIPEGDIPSNRVAAEENFLQTLKRGTKLG